MRSAETELQNTRELRAMASEIVAPKPGSRRQSEKKTILKHFLKGFLEGKSLAPKWRKSADKSLSQPSCSHSNTIYEVQLQKTIDWVAKHNRTTRNGVGNCGSKTGSRRQSEKKTISKHLKAFLEGKSLAPKTHFVRDFLQNSIGNSSTSTTCNPIYIAGTILQLQITMQFLSTAHARKTLETSFTMRNWSDHGPRMIRPHSRPSRTRRTAEVDHRRSGTHFVWKNTGFRASAISQKRISCETSFKTPSATHPPAPLAIPFTLRERSYSCKSQWNSVDRACTKNTWNPIYNAEPIRPWSENGPRMIRPHTRPSRTRRTAEVDHRRSGTHFVWKNTGFRASAISQKRVSCETSFKTPSATHPPAPPAIPFTLRERSYSCKSQWNSVDRACTKNTWNPIYNAEPIRPWSENDPTKVREWSDHTRDRLAPVAPQR